MFFQWKQFLNGIILKAFHKHFQIDLGSVIIKTSTLKKINTDEENIFL